MAKRNTAKSSDKIETSKMSPDIQAVKPDEFQAKLAFYLSLGFWIPLFNIGLCITSIIMASIALKRYFQDPVKYGGLGYIITAYILSIASIILTIIGMFIFLFSDKICGTAICQAYFAN